MSLAELQQMLADALLRPESITRDAAWKQRTSQTLTGSSRMAPVEQLDIYREQFWWRHIACVAEDFPTLVALMGQAAFNALVTAYLQRYPPTDFLLRNLGAGLADFMASRPADDPLHVDVARVEWAFIEAFDAADAPPLDATAVAAIPEDAWPSARIVLHPSLQRLRLMHPAHETRAAILRGGEPDRRAAEPTYLVVYRRELRLYEETMNELAFAMLERLAAGEPLGDAGDAVASASGRGEEVEAHIREWFTRWAALGWISRVDVAQGLGCVPRGWKLNG